MKKVLSVAFFTLLTCMQLAAQIKCGMQQVMDQMTQLDPSFRGKLAAFKAEQVLTTEQYRMLKTAGSQYKTTAAGTIPVVFHIILDSTQVNYIGGVAGIESRLDAQMTVLNEDFGGTNADASQVPDVWTGLFAHAGMRFGRAKTDPSGNPTTGYEIRYVPRTSSFTIDNYTRAAKSYSSGGLSPWDNTRYLNIWIVNMAGSSGGQVLGITVMPGLPGSVTADNGIVLHYLAFGVRKYVTDKYISGSDKGRTLSHEMGHFFGLWHIWGDDDGLCPDDPGGADDDIADTPPQASETYGVHTFPLYDKCSPKGSSNGIMFMNYMDYSADVSLYMFTRDQSLRMNAQIAAGGASQSLTQHPELAGDSSLTSGIDVKIGPNPSTGIVQLIFNRDIDQLLQTRVLDLNGKTILSTDNGSISQLDLSGQPKGMYFIQLRFASGTVVRKIVLH